MQCRTSEMPLVGLASIGLTGMPAVRCACSWSDSRPCFSAAPTITLPRGNSGEHAAGAGAPDGLLTAAVAHLVVWHLAVDTLDRRFRRREILDKRVATWQLQRDVFIPGGGAGGGGGARQCERVREGDEDCLLGEADAHLALPRGRADPSSKFHLAARARHARDLPTACSARTMYIASRPCAHTSMCLIFSFLRDCTCETHRANRKSALRHGRAEARRGMLGGERARLCRTDGQAR